jgi:hypothetical protein
MADVVSQAKKAIGTDDPESDWKLAPETHAERLPEQAGPLRRILQQPTLRTIIDEFEIADSEAVEAQRRYKRVARLRLYTGIAATMIGAVFLVPFEKWLGQSVSIAAAIQYTCLTVSVLASLHLIRARPFDAWMKARARAEIARISLFDQVLGSCDPSPRPDEMPVLPLKLEYFRRYQLDVQRRYYAGRGLQHALAAGQTRRWQIESFVLSALAGGVAMVALLRLVVDHGIQLPEWIGHVYAVVIPILPDWINKAVLATGITASALLGASVSRSLMDLDERNASRYLTTAANLNHICETNLETARADAAAGKTEQVKAFVDSIQRMVSAEHQEWILLSEVLPRTLRRGRPVQVP